ncbi:MAG: hypothetical protein QOH70_846 [Blastocatellia bacterium]|jgi:UDP-glucuronate decarboxylase|nr:hypothetical protein [Blastocatellia bacterium]
MIKWISDYLGTASHDRIVEEPNVRIVDVRDMVDKPGNLPATALEKINEAVAYLKLGERVVVCCDYGISRSNAIAAGIVSRYEGVAFNEAVRKVMEAAGQKEIKIEVLAAVREALGEDRKTRNHEPSEKRILITGGSGFIGKALVGRLTEQEVYVPKRDEIDLVNGAVELDLCIKERNISHLVHLANPRVYTSSRAMGDSLVLLENVLIACRQNKIKLIYLSSWEVFSGYRANSLSAGVALPRLPKGVYGETKYLCELLIEQHHLQYDLEYALLRSSPVYGVDSDKPKFIFNFINKALCNEDIITHRYLNGLPKMDLLFIDDLVAALMSMIERNVGGALNVGSGNAVSTAEVARLIVEMIGSNSAIRHRDVGEYAPNIVMDCSRASAALDWQPAVDLKEGLGKLLAGKNAATGSPVAMRHRRRD